MVVCIEICRDGYMTSPRAGGFTVGPEGADSTCGIWRTMLSMLKLTCLLVIFTGNLLRVHSDHQG